MQWEGTQGSVAFNEVAAYPLEHKLLLYGLVRITAALQGTTNPTVLMLAACTYYLAALVRVCRLQTWKVGSGTGDLTYITGERVRIIDGRAELPSGWTSVPPYAFFKITDLVLECNPVPPHVCVHESQAEICAAAPE